MLCPYHALTIARTVTPADMACGVRLPLSMAHHRRSVRLVDFHYAGGYAYLVTICTHYRQARFGDICDGVVRLSADGKIAERCWLAIPTHFPQVGIDAYTFQPDHLHGIVWIGATRTVGPQPTARASHAVPLPPDVPLPARRFGHLVPGSLPVIIRAYKAAVSRALTPGHGPVWQRGYHESVLRHPGQLARARQYISGHLATRP